MGSSGRVAVYVEFGAAKLKKLCENESQARRKWGSAGRVIMRRITQVVAAECLADLTHRPPFRRHKLSGKRDGQYALDIDGGLRLVLQPLQCNGEPDLTSDPSEVRRVRIMEVIDYHES
jgi:toxin HigB-1